MSTKHKVSDKGSRKRDWFNHNCDITTKKEKEKRKHGTSGQSSKKHCNLIQTFFNRKI